jgi:hypothetical protein
MDWNFKEFDITNNDQIDAHLDKEKGQTILRKVAADSETETILNGKDIQEKKENCIYDLFTIPETGRLNQI